MSFHNELSCAFSAELRPSALRTFVNLAEIFPQGNEAGDLILENHRYPAVGAIIHGITSLRLSVEKQIRL